MKKIHLSLLLGILTISSLFGQDPENTRIYEIRSNIPVTMCNIIGTRYSDRIYIPPYRTRFAFVRNADHDSVLTRILDFETYTDTALKAKAERLNQIFKYNSHGQLRYFKMSRMDMDSNCIKYYNTWFHSISFSLGVITMPLKLRLGDNFDFQGSFSLGTTAGIKMKISHYSPNYLNVLFGASISSVSLDSFSTGGKVPGQPLNNIAAFSPSFGAVFEFGRAQAGIFYGWDLIGKSTQTKYSWIYNGKPWISIGFGFSILSITSKSNESSAAQTSPVDKGTTDDAN